MKKQIKPKRKTSKTKANVSSETIKKREQSSLIRKILRYEMNFTEAITSSYEDDDPTLTSILLYVALYPQLCNDKNSHDYKEFHLLLQNDDDFRARVYTNERPYTYLEDEVFHYSLVPLLHQQLLEAVREVIVSGAGRKYHNTINKIADAIRPKGDEICDRL